jgi:hypothetical protein
VKRLLILMLAAAGMIAPAAEADTLAKIKAAKSVSPAIRCRSRTSSATTSLPAIRSTCASE